MKNNQKFKNFKNIFFLNFITAYEILLILGLLLIKTILNSTISYQKYFNYEAPFYDTGTLMSLLICLEHLFVSYYLIIIIIMVYWCLYVFVVDFLCWNTTNYNYSLKYKFSFFLSFLGKNLMSLYIQFYVLILKFLLLFKEKEYLLFLNLSHINFGRDSSIPRKFLSLFPFHFKKKYLNRINIINILSNNLKHFDLLGRSLMLLNSGIYKFNIIMTLFKESIYLLTKCYDYSVYVVKKKMTNYLFYLKPKSFFFGVDNLSIYKKNKKSLDYSYNLSNLRSNYLDIFSLNQFKHSGIFEAIWAAFPTIIIISILIPSLILLYSFEDILNPKLSVKVIGNQWYWSYEFNNWINFKLESKDQPSSTNINFNENNKVLRFSKSFDYKHVDHYHLAKPYRFLSKNINELGKFTNSVDKNIYMSYAFNSVIVDVDNLDFGFKRLLEVDNRLVLPTNMTLRFLVSSSDVLHSFAVPELGFKVDANPGRLNQILIYISRPGVYYGQCSELCGTSHAFMPIVIQAVSPNNFIDYLEKVKYNLS